MKAKGVVMLCLLVALVAGCAAVGVKPWADRTPQEKASYFMAIYNGQYQDTFALASRADLTETQKTVVRAKREVLLKLWPAILAYDEIVVRGEIPSALDEQKILDYINRLVAMGG